MAKFRYKLQNILNIKLQVEEMRKNELSKVTKRFFEKKERINQIEIKIRNTIDGMKISEKDRIEVRILNSYSHYISRLKVDKDIEIKALKLIEKELEECRNRLIEAVKERKMYETLKEKEFNDFKIEVQKQEDKIMDEIVSFKYGR